MCMQSRGNSGVGRLLLERRLAHNDQPRDAPRSRPPRSSLLTYEAAQHRARRRWISHILPLIEPDANPEDPHRDDDDIEDEVLPEGPDAQPDLLHAEKVPDDLSTCTMDTPTLPLGDPSACQVVGRAE
eukprot:7740649-Pyramimonas_sp.AAC.1